MKFSDYLMTFFILLIFTILYVVGLVLSRIKEIQDNWPKYRCDPAIMIFADFSVMMQWKISVIALLKLKKT